MAITAINLFPAAGANANPNTTTGRQTEATANAPTDTVELTEAQRVFALYNQGQPISQIAQTLSLSVDQVNSYLNISNSGA
jgi:DNA-binding CsgD family transcriptional regulator